MNRYRHRQSGAIFTTSRDMPERDWEPLAQDEPKPEQKPEQRRSRTRKKSPSKE